MEERIDATSLTAGDRMVNPWIQQRRRPRLRRQWD
jgi:hypothetical protein